MLLFAKVTLTLAKEMPVSAAARIDETVRHRLWRVVEHDMAKAVAGLLGRRCTPSSGMSRRASKATVAWQNPSICRAAESRCGLLRQAMTRPHPETSKK